MGGNGSSKAEVAAPYALLLSCPSGLTRSQLSIDFCSSHDRVTHQDSSLEEAIERIWNERVLANPSLFNATKFRYGGYKILDSADDQSSSSRVCLCLGLTDYKTFVGTNLCNQWEFFLSDIEDDVERCKHMASPLGNGAIIETIDNFILALQRSTNVGEFPGHLVFPGGHSEPQEVGITGHVDGCSSGKQELNATISEEMFDGIIREVVEETGVPASYLTDPVFIGISQRVINARPTAFFFVKCSITSLEVLQFYKNAQHGFESTQLLSISKEDLVHAAEKMPGCHQGGAALYQMMKEVGSPTHIEGILNGNVPIDK